MPDKVEFIYFDETHHLNRRFGIENFPLLRFDDDVINLLHSLKKNIIEINVDIFGTCFFLLSRYEEAVLKDTDEHERFPYKSSILNKYNLINRPIVNEYIELLWFYMKKLWPSLERKNHEFRIDPTHDVDNPFLSYLSFGRLLRSIGVDFVKRKEYFIPFLKTKSWAYSKLFQNRKHDIFNNFDQIMDIDEKYGLNSTFYFMSNTSNERYDGNYDIEKPEIRNILNRINDRGHNIGLHTSYETFLNSNLIKNEFDRLKKICDQENIIQDNWGSRQHYLRLKIPETFSNLDKSGLNYDSSLYFGESPGFRSSICFPYKVYDLVKRGPLKILEKPLTIMDISLFEKDYLGLDYTNAMKTIKEVSKQVKTYGGELVLLWHNDSLITKKQIVFYENVLKEITN